MSTQVLIGKFTASAKNVLKGEHPIFSTKDLWNWQRRLNFGQGVRADVKYFAIHNSKPLSAFLKTKHPVSEGLAECNSGAVMIMDAQPRKGRKPGELAFFPTLHVSVPIDIGKRDWLSNLADTMGFPFEGGGLSHDMLQLAKNFSGLPFVEVGENYRGNFEFNFKQQDQSAAQPSERPIPQSVSFNGLSYRVSPSIARCHLYLDGYNMSLNVLITNVSGMNSLQGTLNLVLKTNSVKGESLIGAADRQQAGKLAESLEKSFEAMAHAVPKILESVSGAGKAAMKKLIFAVEA